MIALAKHLEICIEISELRLPAEWRGPVKNIHGQQIFTPGRDVKSPEVGLAKSFAYRLPLYDT
jgi:hypothetical protein